MQRCVITITGIALTFGAVAAITTFVATRHEAHAGSTPTLSINVGSASGCVSVVVGDEIVVSVDISSIDALTAWEGTIVYDPDLIEVQSQDAGIFLRKDGAFVLDASEQPPYDHNGRHFLSAGLVGAPVSGSGPLGTITFKAVDSGITSITIPQRDLNLDGKADEGVWLENAGQFIGDINGDHFFDGPVTPAAIAVGQPCGAVPTESPTDPPTAAPSPTLSPTPTASPTPTVSTTGTPNPTASGGGPGGTNTPTPAPSPTTSLVPGTDLIWGDANCSAAVDPVDSLLTLRHDAGFTVAAQGCPALGQQLSVAAAQTWGDIDCDTKVNPIDALKLLRYDAGLGVSAGSGCPAIGSLVVITPE